MKKIFAILLVAVASLSLAACGSKEFANDGTFTAFNTSSNYGTLMYTWVDVTIEKGKITEFSIDALQGSKDVDGNHVWNAKSKKELGYEYGMHQDRQNPLGLEDYKAMLVEEGLLEWFEQANLIEAKWLADGADSITADKIGDDVDGIAGVTITDGGYVELAIQAVENAKNNLVLAVQEGVSYGKAMVTWVEVQLDDKGKFTSFNIDALQSTVTEGTHAWNAKSKKELGYEYGMHQDRQNPLGLEDYKAMLVEEGLLEWFEQANLIEAKWLADGVDSLAADKIGDEVDGIAGVTITDGGYVDTAKAAVAKIK